MVKRSEVSFRNSRFIFSIDRDAGLRREYLQIEQVIYDGNYLEGETRYIY